MAKSNQLTHLPFKGF